MPTEPLLTISAFARAVGLAPSALRFYDETGLLRPAEVDARTGYRYYTPDLERRAHMIRRMREVGVPVETMRAVLDATPERAAEVLQGVAEQAAESARFTASMVADIVSELRREQDAPGLLAVRLDGPELATALRRVSRAASAEPGSPLHGVLLDVAGSTVTVVATDRYWLATWSLSSPETQVSERRLVVSLDDVEALAGWLHRWPTVTLSLSADSAQVSAGHEDRSIGQIGDRFPAYRLLLDPNTAAQGRATLTRAGLLDIIDEESGAIRLVVGHDRVTVVGDGHPDGSPLPATTTGEPIALVFSATLLKPALEIMVGPEVSLDYAATDRPVRISSPAQRRLQALVMPQHESG